MANGALMARHDFSDRLVNALGRIKPGQGLFFTRVNIGQNHYARVYIPADAGQSRKPSADYSKRYQALFAVLQSPAVDERQSRGSTG